MHLSERAATAIAATLYDLAEAILDSFGFANDHLHAFFLDNDSWSDGNSYYLEPDRGQRDSTKYSLEKAGFQKDLKFVFLFDFGDEWEFKCKVLKELDEATKDTEILRSVGEAPEQYPDYDDEDDDDYDDGEEDIDFIDVDSRSLELCYSDNGYVIRIHDLNDGKTYYKGRTKYFPAKSGITMRDTYTFKGAKVAATNLRNNYSNNDSMQYSVERLAECYIRYDEKSQNDKQYQESLQHAMKRLDELWDKHALDNGDKMRINEVKSILQDFFIALTEKNKGKQ